jgi:hypothetical protein
MGLVRGRVAIGIPREQRPLFQRERPVGDEVSHVGNLACGRYVCQHEFFHALNAASGLGQSEPRQCWGFFMNA